MFFYPNCGDTIIIEAIADTDAWIPYKDLLIGNEFKYTERKVFIAVDNTVNDALFKKMEGSKNYTNHKVQLYFNQNGFKYRFTN